MATGHRRRDVGSRALFVHLPPSGLLRPLVAGMFISARVGAQFENDAGDITVQTTQLGTSRAGYSTYQVAVGFDSSKVEDVYALYGDEGGSPLHFPPGFQAPSPFGTNIGPVNPAFFPISPECEFDSFVAIGLDGPALVPGALSSVGIDFGSWTETNSLFASNGAVFFMDPDHGASAESVVVLQLTVRAGTRFSGIFSAQGRSVAGGDWEKVGISFNQGGGNEILSCPTDPDLVLLDAGIGICVPANVATAPPDAVRSRSGLSWTVLRQGYGSIHPEPSDIVSVRYSGWTADGQMFDSSGDEQREMPLNIAIRGWQEGLALMVAGEKRRFWVPSRLAYGDRGTPAGDLVFDIELFGMHSRAPPPPPPCASLACPRLPHCKSMESICLSTWR